MDREQSRGVITRAGLSLRSPFKAITAQSIAKALEYLATQMHAAGKILARYSVHDLPHAAPVRLHQATHHIYQG